MTAQRYTAPLTTRGTRARRTAPPPRPHTSFDRFVLRTGDWFAEHTLIRFIAAAAALTLTLTPGVLLLINPDLTDRIEGLATPASS